MATGLHGGSRWDPPNVHSLASFMEDAFDDVRAEFDLPPLPAEGVVDRRMLFISIARGIVDYLGQHSSAFVIQPTSVGHHGSHHHGGGTVKISVEPIPPRPIP